MKYLIVFLISGSALACKLEPKSALRSEKAAAIATVKSKNNSSRNMKVRHDGIHLLVRTVKPTCIEYNVKINRTPDCKMHPEIVSEKPCT